MLLPLNKASVYYIYKSNNNFTNTKEVKESSVFEPSHYYI